MISIKPIPAFSDNYIWAISDEDENYYAVVDPGDAVPVLEFLAENDAILAAVMITHHHADHVGGICGLLDAFPGTPVYGPVLETIPCVTHSLGDGDRVVIPEIDVSFDALSIPGHTAGHIGYYREGMLFCGDTLFANGCGRVFDGSMISLFSSLKKIASLPANTLIYCAHEYTLDNIGFAQWVEPENLDLLHRQQQTHDLIDNDQPSVPSTLELEFKTNPFLRTSEPAVIEAAEKEAKRNLPSEADVFKVLRTWKDRKYD